MVIMSDASEKSWEGRSYSQRQRTGGTKVLKDDRIYLHIYIYTLYFGDNRSKTKNYEL